MVILPVTCCPLEWPLESGKHASAIDPNGDGLSCPGWHFVEIRHNKKIFESADEIIEKRMDSAQGNFASIGA